jgi:uncharacterized protein
MPAIELATIASIEPILQDKTVAHLVLDKTKVVSSNTVPGLIVDVKEEETCARIAITLEDGVVVAKPVHLCFGMIRHGGVQKLVMDLNIGKNARIPVMAHCVFPTPMRIQHIMDARIHVGEGSEYIYLERHIHSPQGGIEVYPKAKVDLARNARFRTDFELVKGRVGLMEIDYEATCGEGSVLEMTAKVSGSGDDVIKITETGHLVGEGARGVLTSRVAVRQNARAEIYNRLNANAAGARGHVDCKEIIQDNAVAKAVPIVEVSHPKAHVTHEAAIGSVDTKQLQTLMARGLSEDEAVDLIIQGLLS